MSALFAPKKRKVRVLQGEKTSYPLLRELTKGQTHETFAFGELVGLQALAGGAEKCVKITSDAVAAVNNVGSLMRMNTTQYDVEESNAITLKQGLYRVSTELYLKGQTYTQGMPVTVRFDSTTGAGVFGPVDGASTHVLGHVVSPPLDSTAGSAMTLLVYPTPQKK